MQLDFYPRRDALLWLTADAAPGVTSEALARALDRQRARSDPALRGDTSVIVHHGDDDEQASVRLLVPRARAAAWQAAVNRLAYEERALGARADGGAPRDASIYDGERQHLLFGPSQPGARPDDPVYLLSGDELSELYDDTRLPDAAFGLLETLRAHDALETGVLAKASLTRAALVALGYGLRNSEPLHARSAEARTLRAVALDPDAPEALRDLAVALLEAALMEPG